MFLNRIEIGNNDDYVQAKINLLLWGINQAIEQIFVVESIAILAGSHVLRSTTLVDTFSNSSHKLWNNDVLFSSVCQIFDMLRPIASRQLHENGSLWQTDSAILWMKISLQFRISEEHQDIFDINGTYVLCTKKLKLMKTYSSRSLKLIIIWYIYMYKYVSVCSIP